METRFSKILERGSNFVLKLVLVFTTASGKSAQNCEVKTNYSELDSETERILSGSRVKLVPAVSN